jgi:hypothetical protein
MPDQVRHDRIQNLVSTVSVVVGLEQPINWTMRSEFLPFSRPSITEEDIAAIGDVLR